MTATQITDSRDLIEEANTLAGGDWEAPDLDMELDAEDRARLDHLAGVLVAIGSEAQYGVALIPEHEFEDYARELAEDIGAIDADAGWPLHCIDWEWAARELAMDYTTVEFEGTTHLYCS